MELEKMISPLTPWGVRLALVELVLAVGALILVLDAFVDLLQDILPVLYW